MPHLIVKSSASVLVMKAMWWTVLIKEWSTKCMCDIDIAMLFLMLTSVTTMAIDGEENDCKTILSSCWKHNLSFFPLLAKLKENWSGKLSTILEPRKSSEWRGENAGKTPYNLLLESIRKPLMIVLWWFVSVLIEWERGLVDKLERSFMSVLIVRHSSHQGGSLQKWLGGGWTCGTTLALAYMLCCLSAMWSQLQMMGRSPR